MTLPHNDHDLHALPSPEIPLPTAHHKIPPPQPPSQQRAFSATAMSSDLQKSVMRHQDMAELRRPAQDQPWWQRYYQLYHYHPPPGRKPTVFGPYLLLQTLGEGEFGKVKLGIHIKTGHEVAIKLMKKDSITSSARMAKVEREISVLRSVRHPYIVKLYDVMETEKYIGIILQCASGGELFEYILAHRFLKEKDASRLFAQLISGVHYMHEKHIVHRDLKLENLLLDKNRNIIITDFGFANQFSSTHDDLMSTSCGSPCYAAPELVVSEGLYVGSAVDIWSCGVILYAMLCGYLPFDDDPANPDGDNINLLYKYILNTPLSFPDYISEDARDLLRRMLVPDPAKRCSIDTIMGHAWLAEHRALFEKSFGDLERDAMRSPDIPIHVLVPPPQRQTQNSRRNTIVATYTPAESAPQESQPSKEDSLDTDTTDLSPVNTSSIATAATTVDLPTSDSQASVVPTCTTQSSLDESTPETEQIVPTTTTAPSVPAVIETREGSGETSPASPVPSPSKTTDRIRHFLTGTTSMGRQSAPKPRPMSASAAPQHANAAGTQRQQHGSILQSKFLSSLQRHGQEGRPRSSTHTSRPPPSISVSTPYAVAATVATATATAVPSAQRRPVRPVTVNQPKPTVGVSSPVRGPRRKALSLLVNSMTDYISQDDKRKSSRAGATEPSTPTTRRHESSSSSRRTGLTMASAASSSSSSQHVLEGADPLVESSASDYTNGSTSIKQRSAGKKLMHWLKSKPVSTRGERDLANHRLSSQAMARGKPFGYAVDDQDVKLRTHHGAVDQDALTARPLHEVFAQVRDTLEAMGIDVKRDGEYKLKCTRRKRRSPGGTSAHAGPRERTSTMQPSTSFRMLLRRTTHSTPGPKTRPPAHEPTHQAFPTSTAPTYGDPSVDSGDEVRFSVELCKIKNLPGLYIVDIRRMRGSVWSYKHLYHVILDTLNLSAKGGYISTTTAQSSPPSSSTHATKDAGLLRPHHHDPTSHHRVSVASSFGSSNIPEETS